MNNINRLTEYHILNVLLEMIMVSIAYRTKKNTPDHAIVRALVASFTGQLKGWWDHYLDNPDRVQILNAIKRTAEGVTIKDEEGLEVQDVVPTLIFAVAKYFIGDPSKFKDRTSEFSQI